MMVRGLRSLIAACALGLVAACSHTPPDATPEGAVREFIERMERVDGDPERARAAYELLSASTRENLIERARRASHASGRPMKPEEMLAPSRFVLLFRPHQMQARITGNRAVVDVTGMDPNVDRAQVPLVREDGRWRVELDLPTLPPVEMRPTGN